MGNTTLLTKKQKFLAGVVCSLIVLTLADVLNRLGDAFAYAPRRDDLILILAGLCSLPLLLKFILSDWQPHQKWLGWLLALAFAVSLLFEVYSFITFWDGQIGTSDAVRTGSLVLNIIFTLIKILLNPLFPLLIGIARKESTEKIAGAFAAISLGSLAVSLIFTNFKIAGGVPPIYLVKLFTYTAYTILFFTWPVLTRPILEREKNL